MVISVVIPAFNEEAAIGDTVTTILDYFHLRGLEGEVLVADDGSTDATAARAAAAGARILQSPINRGKGDAVRRGMMAAQGKMVIFIDADLSTPIDEMDRVIPLVAAGHPVVIGSRKLEPARVLERQPLYRQFMGRVFSWLCRRLLHPQVTDFTCGFKAFDRDVVVALFQPLTLTGWAFDAELLHVAWRQRIPVKEIPVAWKNRRDSRVRLSRDVLSSALGVATVLYNGWRGRYNAGPQST